MKPAWHALLAPLPPDAEVQRKPVAPPEMVGTGQAEAVAGWENVSVQLSAGSDGLRHFMVTLDATGTPISAGDGVLYCTAAGDEVKYVHESVGGRLEPDGTFHGTRWRTVNVGKAGGEEAETREQQKSNPSAEDIRALKRLIQDLLKLA